MTETPIIRRSLTEQELDKIRTAINDAAKTHESRAATAVTTVFEIMLGDVGLSWETFSADDKMDPRNIAIPSEQWKAIATWCHPEMLSWMNWGPSSYEVSD